MKKVFLFCALTLSCATVFAQDGLFVKAGAGAGTSSSSFSVVSGDAYKNNMDVLSAQAQLNLGYSYGNWQLETGLGYWHSGVSFIASNGIPGCMPSPSPLPAPDPLIRVDAVKYTVKNAHLTAPLIVSYTIHSCKKISLSPGIGMEALYNFKGKMTANKSVDPATTDEVGNYNNFGAALLLKFDIQYKLNNDFSVWVSPSYQNMLTSLTTKVQGDNMSRVYDRAFLFNAGVRYNLHCACHKPQTTVNN